MTDAAATELTGAGRGNLPGMSQRQLTCAALEEVIHLLERYNM